MNPKNSPSRAIHPVLAQIAEHLETNRADLILCCEQALRAHVFTNRFEFRPGNMRQLAEQEADAFINALHTSFANTRQHGVRLCQAGLSIQTIFGIIHAEMIFLMNSFQNDATFLEISSEYPFKLFEGFMAERENVIFKDQENIREAFEIALERSNAQTQEAQANAKKITEMSYRKIIQAQEDERRRISRQLHDEAGQSIVGIRLSLQTIKTNLSDKPGRSEINHLKDDLEKTIFWTENATQTIRNLAYRLRPPVLDMLGLNLAIKQLCIDFSEQTSLIISYAGTETPNLSDELSISIYRIVQEALTNIVKHAGAKHAWIKLSPTQELIKLSISDDGQGFDPEMVLMGIGMESMRERCNLLNGEMRIKASPGNPVLLNFSFPVILKMPLEGEINGDPIISEKLQGKGR